MLGEEAEPELNIIVANCHDNVIKCCSSTFSLWLERQPEANWRQLITALRNVKLVELATNVEKLLILSTADPQGSHLITMTTGLNYVLYDVYFLCLTDSSVS